MLHHIQKSIIELLGFHTSLRYSELKPHGLDGNIFGYHLKQVISDKYVCKIDDGSYALSTKGRDFFVRRFENTQTSAHSIFLIVVKRKNSYLLRRRKVQPFIGKVGFIHGEPTPGMPIQEAARRRLKQKSGLILDLEVRASALITQYHSEELLSYSHATILYGETTDTILVSSDETGENLWSEDMAENDVLPSCRDIIELLETAKPWAELSYTL